MHITISNFSELNKILDLIHDMWFKEEDINFISETSSLEIKFKRELTANARLIKTILFFKKWEVPIIESVLTIHFVEHYSVKNNSETGNAYFNTIKLNGRDNLLIVCDLLDIDVKIKKFQIEMKDIDNIAKNKVYYSILGCVIGKSS